jgi:hypothetical protein
MENPFQGLGAWTRFGFTRTGLAVHAVPYQIVRMQERRNNGPGAGFEANGNRITSSGLRNLLDEVRAARIVDTIRSS